MKSLLFITLFMFTSFALASEKSSLTSFTDNDPVIVSCKNGDITEVGDVFLQIDILKDGAVSVQQYETSYSMNANQVNTDRPNYYSVVNQPIEFSSEGEIFIETVNALFILSKDQASLNAQIQDYEGEMISYSLKCENIVFTF